jgi:hypothetical protein
MKLEREQTIAKIKKEIAKSMPKGVEDKVLRAKFGLMNAPKKVDEYLKILEDGHVIEQITDEEEGVTVWKIVI